MKQMRRSKVATHLILGAWALIVLFPLWTMLSNSLKPKRDIFRNPYGIPDSITFDGYVRAWTDGDFALYFRNSLFVTITAIVLVMFIGSLAAYALANWRSRTSTLIYLGFIAGMMVPIRLGTINLIQILKQLGLIDTMWGLIPIYVAMSLPIGIFVLTAFVRGLPHELGEAGRVDGASEWQMYYKITLPLIRPALATVAIFSLIPIWNDIWFPLILISDDSHNTVMLGVTALFGQYQTDWNRILSALSLSALPILVLYLLLSKQFIRGLTSGAVKG